MPATIRMGSTGEDVVLCQQRLNVYGWLCAVDGIFGPDTDANVRAFQQEEGLVVDGIVGPATWSALLTPPVEENTPPVYDDLTDLDRRMLCEISAYIGWDYSAKGDPSLVALPSRLAPDAVVWEPGRKTDTVCCVFVGGVAGRVYDTVAQWTAHAWERFMVPLDEPWGMVNECVEAGVGRIPEGAPEPGKWYIVQEWSDLQDGVVIPGVSYGHQYLQWGPDLIAEANGGSVGGVAWRQRAWPPSADEVRYVELLPVAG